MITNPPNNNTNSPQEDSPLDNFASPQKTSARKSLSVRQRLLLGNLIIGIPLFITSALLLSNEWRSYQLSAKQSEAVTAYKYMQGLQFNVRSMRGYEATDVPKEYILAAKKLSKELLAATEKTKLPATIKIANNIITEVDTLAKAIDADQISFDGILKATDKILYNELQIMFNVLANEGNLFFIKDTEKHDVARLGTHTLPVSLPKIGGEFGKIMSEFSKARELTDGKLSAENIAQITSSFEVSSYITREIESEIGSILSRSEDARSLLDPLYKKALQDTRNAFQFAYDHSVKTGTVQASNADLINISDKYLVSQYQAFDATVKYVNKLYEAQKSKNRIAFFAILIGVGLFTILAILINIKIIRSIIDPLAIITNASDRLATGDLNVRVPILDNDELGKLGRAFNMAALTIQTNEDHVRVERKDAQRLQANIGQFLDVTLDIADGDLTKRGKVTEDVLGNVVDSINLMIDELSQLLIDVKNTAHTVDNGSASMLYTTSQIQEGSVLTTNEAAKVAQQAQFVNSQIHKMATMAQDSAKTAQSALKASEEGLASVQSTLNNMHNLRENSQSVSERVIALSKRSEEIQDVVDYISQITGQVNLLALHASIEAAGAGESGSRFAVVAEEVRQLAELSTEATDKIANLIGNVQVEIKEVTRSIQSNVAEVEKGYTVADQAGQRLREIATLTQDSADLAVNISDVTSSQVDEINEMGEGMKNISNIAAQTQNSVQSGQAAAEQLRELASKLNKSLQRFKLSQNDPTNG